MAAPLVRQFSAYRPFPDLAVDGTRTRGENVADLAGLTAAFEAWRGVSDGMDSAALRRGDRDFFLAWAASWRGKFRDEELRKRVASDDHAPDNYRINTVRNIDAWYAAFDVKPGDRLYLAPEARVRVW
jgi:predicted metalloendopeptidase